MSLQAVLIEKIKQLPQDQQMLVKSLVEELARTRGGRHVGKSGGWFGALEHLGVEIAEADIAEARREMVSRVEDHGAITPQECRELLGLGESRSARVEVSRYLKEWSGPGGFLRREGKSPKTRYLPTEKQPEPSDG
jgi:hypothetical protein